MCCCSPHLRALLKKNYIRWKRNPCGSCCEILLPVILMMFMFVFRANIEKNEVDDQTYTEYKEYSEGFFPAIIRPDA
jgi:ATP-binding cassette subfamily A (ABC1) protein 3